MKVLIDTNIVIDIALQRQPFFAESDEVFTLVEQNQIEGFISASTISNLYYIIRKAQGHDWTVRFLERLLSMCQVARVDRTVIEMAFTTNFADFEDAIQYSCAIVNALDAIVTRNPQDDNLATLSIFTSSALIQTISS